jgi:hypothetical protein
MIGEPVEAGFLINIGEPKRRCARCKQVKAVSDFVKNKNAKNGLSPYCKGCGRQQGKEKYGKPNQKKSSLIWRLKRNFGLTLEEYEAMRARQNDLCAICQRPEGVIGPRSTKIMSLSIDHDHKTGKVRELLCHHCNNAIARMQDNHEWMIRAAQYILKHKNKLDE